MKKVLLIQGTIPHYRVPIFNKLAESVDLTVLYSYGKLPEGIKFKTLCVPTFNCRLQIHKQNIYALAHKFDAVICILDFSYLYSRLLHILPHRYKLIYWGIGVSASYNARYDEDASVAQKNFKISKRADAMVFYSEYPVQKYSNMGISKEKLFAANNTVLVSNPPEAEKDSILFVGSLYKQKKIEELLSNYFNAYKKNQAIPNLVIVGDGEEYKNIEDWIMINELNHKIELKGAIYDDNELSKLFSRAIICISPDQAGLSVLKAMGNGVPYVTHKEAITGGEIFNIKNGENGVLIDRFDELEAIILSCVDNREKFIEMGEKAKNHYDTQRTVSQMVKGFVDAVDYVCKNKRR